MAAKLKSVYCHSCNSCGEDGCCSYLKCVQNSIELNPDCKYHDRYKSELLLRHEFMKAAFDMAEISPEFKQFVETVFDIAEKKSYEPLTDT